jgi:hypothetical protein
MAAVMRFIAVAAFVILVGIPTVLWWTRLCVEVFGACL